MFLNNTDSAPLDDEIGMAHWLPHAADADAGFDAIDPSNKVFDESINESTADIHSPQDYAGDILQDTDLHSMSSEDDPALSTQPLDTSPDDSLRRSDRDKRPPIWMTEYVTAAATTDQHAPHSICHSISHDVIHKDYKDYLTEFSAIEEPRSYNHREGSDYNETFSPVVKITTVRSVIAFAAAEGWYIHQMDVYNVFLQGDLHDKIYMQFQRDSPSRGSLELYAEIYNQELDEVTGEEGDELLEDRGKYQRLIGKLLYLTMTRLDIAFAIQTLSQFLQQPKKSHWEEALRVMRYVKRELGLGILMSSKRPEKLKAYYDADWASFPI
nr:uncharacterized protein LOC117276371 [Nicotiana tomentosiformis]